MNGNCCSKRWRIEITIRSTRLDNDSLSVKDKLYGILTAYQWVED